MKKQNEISVILGRKGSGKTSLCFNLIKEAKRLIIFDYLNEYDGFYVVGTPAALLEVLKLNLEGTFKICYRPSPELDLDEHFAHLSSAAFCLRDVTFVCEEIDLVSTAGDMPDGLKKIINYGRHRGINVIGLSRRAHRVPRDLTANADVIYTFAQHEPRDIKYLADCLGEAVSVEAPLLKKTETTGEFIAWQNTGEHKKGTINFIDKSLSYHPE